MELQENRANSMILLNIGLDRIRYESFTVKHVALDHFTAKCSVKVLFNILLDVFLSRGGNFHFTFSRSNPVPCFNKSFFFKIIFNY